MNVEKIRIVLPANEYGYAAEREIIRQYYERLQFQAVCRALESVPHSAIEKAYSNIVWC